jgi:hypothetical protein
MKTRKNRQKIVKQNATFNLTQQQRESNQRQRRARDGACKERKRTNKPFESRNIDIDVFF